MNYEAWTTLYNASIVGVLVLPIVLAIVVFFRQRRRRSAEGKRTGRPVVWSLVTIVGSFFTLLIAWGLALVEPFPEYMARQHTEYAASSRARDDLNLSQAVDLCAEQYRRSDSQGWDRRFDVEHAATFNMASSTNEHFREMSDVAGERGVRLYMVWIPRRGETVQLDSDGMASTDPERNNVCIMGIDGDDVWHNVGAGMLEAQEQRRRESGDRLNACMRDCNQRYTNDEYVSDRFYSCAAACRVESR